MEKYKYFIYLIVFLICLIILFFPGSRVETSEKKWKKLEGEFLLHTKPERVELYLEGPPPGADLLIRSVSVFPSTYKKFEVCLFYNPNLDWQLDEG